MGADYFAQKGDYLAKIASARGIRDWRALYEHAANEGLRELRQNPNMLAEGDRVYIPSLTKEEHPADTDQCHTFELPLEQNDLHLILRRSDGEPFANTPCVLRIGAKTFNVTTDGDGVLRHPNLPPTAEAASLAFAGQVLPLLIGHLEPASELRGVQGRLRNLGHYVGPCTGVMDDATSTAIGRFKEKHNLGEGDQLNAEVTDKLVEEYGQ